MPLIEDHPVHPKVKHDKVISGCYNRPRTTPTCYYTFTGEIVLSRSTSVPCCQIGRKVDGKWQDLPECEGCESERDATYIEGARLAIDREFA